MESYQPVLSFFEAWQTACSQEIVDLGLVETQTRRGLTNRKATPDIILLSRGRCVRGPRRRRHQPSQGYGLPLSADANPLGQGIDGSILDRREKVGASHLHSPSVFLWRAARLRSLRREARIVLAR